MDDMKGRCGIYQNVMERDKIVTYLEGVREEMENVLYVCIGFGANRNIVDGKHSSWI
jgi:hypothetical protein